MQSQVPHSDSGLFQKQFDASSDRRSLNSASEPILNRQDSYASNRSRKTSNKVELPPSSIVRSKSSFSLHILDSLAPQFQKDHLEPESLKESLTKINQEQAEFGSLTEFQQEWTSDPLFRLYLLMFLVQVGHYPVFVVFFLIKPFDIRHVNSFWKLKSFWTMNSQKHPLSTPIPQWEQDIRPVNISLISFFLAMPIARSNFHPSLVNQAVEKWFNPFDETWNTILFIFVMI
jgi:hypothetical protein